MENSNDPIKNTSTFILNENRAFKYGDAVFDTLKYANSKLEFLEDHYFRLMASMRLLRMEIPMYFTMEFYEKEILKSIDFSLPTNQFRVRVTVFRADGGRYLPTSNKIHYFIETSPLENIPLESYEIDIFKDFTLSRSYLSTLKTTNRLLNVLASIYADENQLQNCLLLNDQKQVVEMIHGNVFLVKDTSIYTPPLSEGCINGIYRRKLMEVIQKYSDFVVEEKPLSYTDFLNASEVFMTNSIVGIQSVTKFKKKTYQSTITEELKELMLKKLV